MSTTLERVTKVVVDKLQVQKEEVREDASFQDDLGADSLSIVDLVMGLEDEFDIRISDEDAEKIQTVAEAVTYIEDKQG